MFLPITFLNTMFFPDETLPQLGDLFGKSIHFHKGSSFDERKRTYEQYSTLQKKRKPIQK
jgi:hypothetical protein